MISRPDQVTPEWITAALRASGAAPPGARVTAVRGSPLPGGQLGWCVRFRLSWSGPPGGPGSLVGKFPAADRRSRLTGVGSAVYRRELEFYTRLARQLPIRVPRCHLAEHDPATGEFAVLLADAAPARPRDQLRGADPADIALALAELARLQAAFWGGTGLAGHGWLPVRGAGGGRRRAAIYQLLAGRFLTRYGPRLSPLARRVLAGFGSRVRRWAAAEAPPFTLLHGDLRLDNLLFGDGRTAARLTVVDWQTVAVGAGAADAAHLIGGGLPVPVRRANEPELFRLYRRALRAGGVSWPEPHCRYSYRLGSLAGLHLTVVGAMLVGPDPAGDARFLSMAERHAAHAADLAALALLDAGR
jgi:hypothetical protein